MTTQKTENQKTKGDEKKDLSVPVPKPALAMTGKGFEPKDIDQAWRFAQALANSTVVPERYKGRPGDCLIALDLSLRLNVPWLAVMQHVYTVKGRPAMESVLSTALTNRSGLFVDPLEYEVEGKNGEDPNYCVRAFAKRKSTGTVLYGPWITWKLVKAEGWLNKDGSKWKTMPEQMFHYRAASWFERRHCPEVTMGMLTPEEAEEIPPAKPVESLTYDETEKQVQEKIEAEQGSEPVDTNFEPETQPQPEQEEEKPAKTKRKKTAKKKEKKIEFLWHCNGCGLDFDEPKMSGSGDNLVGICPKCLTSDIRSNKKDWLKELALHLCLMA
jgi:hypothetical protein